GEGITYHRPRWSRCSSSFLRLLVSPFRSISRLEAENAALRRQLIVLQRRVRGRAQFTKSGRLFFLQLYRWFPSIASARVYLDKSERSVRRKCVDHEMVVSTIIRLRRRGGVSNQRRGGRRLGESQHGNEGS